MLTDSVQSLLHLELLLLDSKVVALVKRVKDLIGRDWGLGDVLVDLRHLTVKDDSDILKLREESLKDSLLLFQL